MLMKARNAEVCDATNAEEGTVAGYKIKITC